jgi:hypothetical protein
MAINPSTPHSWVAALLLAVPLWAFIALPASALIVVPPATNDNTTAPADDPGWANVGDNGIYLGNRWVITAAHVGAQTTSFTGIGSFTVVSGSAIQLQNPAGSGLTTSTDLLMFRLANDPGLPSLSIATTGPAQGDQVTFIGDGGSVTPSATETHWNVTESGGVHTWTEVPSGGNFSGYKSTTSRKLWGTNLVENGGPVIANDGIGDVISFDTKFDDPNAIGSTATASEAQAQSGDSGSAVFNKVGDLWVLAGVTYAVDNPIDNQPNPTSNAVFGNLTFAADLSQYRDQILAIIPEASSVVLVSGVVTLAAAWHLLARRRRPTRATEARVA